MCRMRLIMLGTEDETFAVTSFAALGRCCVKTVNLTFLEFFGTIIISIERLSHEDAKVLRSASC